jgi:very-short-patch-repair endonuclease
MKRIDPEITARARLLRNNATPEERAMWRILSPFRPRFTRQLSVGGFIIDIACRKVMLAVELDGGQHAEAANVARDSRRTAWLESQGWTVIRFWNSEVRENPEGVGLAILARAAECLGGTHPQPLPRREGRRRKSHSPAPK